MKVLFDTNVIMDVLLDREPFSTAAAELLSRAERGDIAGYACGTTITTIHYLCSKVLGRGEARKKLRALLSVVEIAPVAKNVVVAALESPISDFEDAVLSEAANLVSVHAIVTRNKKDFSGARVPVYTPPELLRLLDSGEEFED